LNRDEDCPRLVGLVPFYNVIRVGPSKPKARNDKVPFIKALRTVAAPEIAGLRDMKHFAEDVIDGENRFLLVKNLVEAMRELSIYASCDGVKFEPSAQALKVLEALRNHPELLEEIRKALTAGWK
jgi:hypothetical protein